MRREMQGQCIECVFPAATAETLGIGELDGVTGGIPGLGTIYTQAIGNGTSQAVGAVVSNAGYPSRK
jgi:hypothetical protein